LEGLNANFIGFLLLPKVVQIFETFIMMIHGSEVRGRENRTGKNIELALKQSILNEQNSK
jgi:hypothetical protein